MWKIEIREIGVMNMAYIMESGQNKLYTTFTNFFHKNWPYRSICRKRKNNFPKKKNAFFIENVL